MHVTHPHGLQFVAHLPIALPRTVLHLRAGLRLLRILFLFSKETLRLQSRDVASVFGCHYDPVCTSVWKLMISVLCYTALSPFSEISGI